MLHGVHVEQAVVLVGDLNDILIQIKGALVAGVVILAGAVLVFQIDGGPAVDHLQVAAAEGGGQLGGAAVEHDHVGAGQLFHHQLSEVAGVAVKGGGLHKGHHLIQQPVGGENLGLQFAQLPHAVPLDDDLLGLVLLFQLFQQGELQIAFIFNVHHGDVGG